MSETERKTDLTWEDVKSQCDGVKDFFSRLPEGMHAGAADMIIREIIIWASYNDYEALGILMGVMLEHWEVSRGCTEEESSEESED